MSWPIALIIVLGGLIGFNLLHRLWGRHKIRKTLALPPDEVQTRLATDLSSRIFVERSIPGGPRARSTNRTPWGQLQLTSRRLRFVTGQGCLMELSAERPGEARCVGPRRLVLEGNHPRTSTAVRIEMLVDDPEGWVAAATQLTTSADESVPEGSRPDPDPVGSTTD